MARAIARRLGFFLLDTGAIYRSLALYAQQRGIEFSDGPQLGRMASSLPIRFGRGIEEGKVFLAGTDVSLAIRSPEISQGLRMSLPILRCEQRSWAYSDSLPRAARAWPKVETSAPSSHRTPRSSCS